MTGASRSLVPFAKLVLLSVGFGVGSFSLVCEIFPEEAVFCKDGEGISVFFAGVNPFFPACSKSIIVFIFGYLLKLKLDFLF